MAHTKYEVILQQDVANLGKSGDVVRVRPGYARNFLVPQKLAMPATARNRAQIEHQKRTAVARAAKQLASAEAIAKRLAEVTLTISAAAGEENRLYGAVTSRDIAAALASQGLTVDHRTIKLAEPIKRLGSYPIPIRLGSSVSAEIKVEVVAKS
jgi:large subunit ribosomal protein L9